jgi:hypothetical protein
MPRSAASTRTRVTRSGSTISIDIGPTRVCVRSAGMRLDANTERWTPSCTVENAASMMPRFGYTAMPTAK